MVHLAIIPHNLSQCSPPPPPPDPVTGLIIFCMIVVYICIFLAIRAHDKWNS